MKEFFSVISYMSPITIILILYVPIVFITLLYSKTVFGKARKALGSLAFLLLIYFLIIGQELVGSTYHEYLCETQAGYKNYSQIKLPAEYWNKDGSPVFVDGDGKVQHKKINGWFDTDSVEIPEVKFFIKINKYKFIYIDKNTKVKIGEKVNFVRYFGWLNEYTLSRSRSVRCNIVFASKIGWDDYQKNNKINKINFIMNLFRK